jgi:hypothetical protein
VTQHPNVDRTVEPTATPAEPVSATSWPTEVGELLAKAAALCVEHGLDLEAWMRGAWTSYVEARPGFREYLEEQQLKGQLDELRKAGRVGQA